MILEKYIWLVVCLFFQAEDGIRDGHVTGVQTCALPIYLHQFSTLAVMGLLLAFYGGTYLLTLLIKKQHEDTDAFMVSNRAVDFGMGAASMTATWIWAASFYAAATSGYTYGLSGPLHYGL